MVTDQGFKLTEIGLIPSDWNISNLGSIIDYVKGYAFKASNYRNDGTRIIRVSDIKTDSISDENAVFIESSKENVYRKWRIKENDLIITTVGSKPPVWDSLVGKCIRVDKRNSGALLNQNAVLLRNKRNSEHLQVIISSNLRTKRYIRHIEEIFRGNANQASITLIELFTFKLALPQKPLEQKATAEALSNMDALISSLNALIAKKRAIKQGVMQELLTGRRRLTGFNEEWESKEIQDICEIDPDNLGSETRPDYTFKYISLEDVDRGVLKSWTNKVFSSAPSRARRKVKKYDVLFGTVRPNLQSHSIIKEDIKDLVCSTGFSVIRCKAGISHPYYVFFQLFSRFIEKQIEALVTGSNYPAISSSDVKHLLIRIPKDFMEQTAIAEILIDIETEIIELDRRLIKIRKLKQGMMQELLTGRIRLIKE